MTAFEFVNILGAMIESWKLSYLYVKQCEIKSNSKVILISCLLLKEPYQISVACNLRFGQVQITPNYTSELIL